MKRSRKKLKMHDISDSRRAFWETNRRERIDQMKKHALSLELVIAREIKDPQERARSLCVLANRQQSMGSDPSPILIEALRSADSVKDDLEKGVILMEVAGFFKSSGSDPMPLLARAIEHINRSPSCGLVKDALFIRIGNICMELREYDAALDAVARVSDPSARAVVLTLVQADRAKALSYD